MPYRLKKILAENGYTQDEWRQAVKQDNGRVLSKSAATQLLEGVWPRRTSQAHIQNQTRLWLIDRGLGYLDKPAWEFETAGASDQTNASQTSNRNIEIPEAEMLTQKAKRHFGLFKDPFLDDVQNPDDVFLSAEQRYIRESLYQAAKHAGFLAVVGESGAGKSTLRRDLVDRIARDGDAITIIQPRTIDKGRLTAGSICDAIVGDLSSEPPKRSLEAKARQVERLLVGSSRSGNAHALVIEEAHDLTIQTLKYLKRFWELEDGFKKLLAIILVGQPELKDKLDERKHWDAREVIRRIELAELLPLDAALGGYLALKFKRVGSQLDGLFAADAVDAITQRLTLRRRGQGETISMAYPLTVNNLVTKAMNLAADIGSPTINADLIAEV